MLFAIFRSCHPEVFLGKGVLKIYSKFTGEHPCQSAISIKLLCNFIEIALRHGCSPVNLLYIFRTPFPRNISGWLLLEYVCIRSVALNLELLPNLLRFCTEIYLAIIYYFFMILLILDRFLVFYLNLKYTVYCTPKKLLKIVYSMMVLSAICVLILLATIHLEQMSFPVINLVAMFVFTVIDSLYVIVAVIIYAYIFVVYKRQMITLVRAISIARTNVNSCYLYFFHSFS